MPQSKLDKTAADHLREMAAFYEKRNEEYGNAHTRHGKIMAAFFPDGITLKTAADFHTYHAFELIVIKLNRIAGQFPIPHMDSWLDLCVYGAIAIEEIKKGDKANE